MNQRRLIAGLISAFMAAALPVSAQAAALLQSQNFQMDSINFGSNITLVTTLDQQPPAISSEGPTVSELKPTQATITWKTDKKSSSAVYYGETSAYGQQTGTPDRVTTHIVTVYGLTPQTTYHYKVSSVEIQGAVGESPDHAFSTPAQNGVESIKVSNVEYDSAIVSWQTGNVTTSTLDYGLSTAYGQKKSDLSGSFTTNHTVQLTSLEPGSDYHVRISATDGQGNQIVSSDFGFTTLANPSFTLLKAVNDSPNEVALNWNTNVPTTGIIKVTQKGSAAGSQSLGAGDLLMQHVTVIGMLYGETTYQAVVTATDAQGHQVVSGIQEFTTPKDTVPPDIQDLKVNVTQSGSALVMAASWKTNKLADTQAKLADKTGASPESTLPSQASPTIDHIMAKADLLPATPYSLTVISTDPAGNTGTKTISFITPAVHKSILQLLLDSLSNAFGWAGKIGK